MSQDLARLVDVIDAKIAAMDAELGPRPGWETDNMAQREDYRRREQAALDVLLLKLVAEEGGTTGFGGWGDYYIRLGGFRSSSTSGWRGCLSNWQAAARKRIAKAEA